MSTSDRLLTLLAPLGDLYLRSEWVQALGGAAARTAERLGAWPARERRRRLALARALALAHAAQPAVQGRVLLVNLGLSAGGAERQILATLTGLAAAGIEPRVESATLLVSALPADGSRSFYLPEARRLAVALAEIGAGPDSAPALSPERARAEAAVLAYLPAKLARLAGELRREFAWRRPQVVHAWQDSTAIAAGVAGLLAGVPRIVLGARNMAPPAFLYWRPCLRPWYRVLAEFPGVALVNNSAAGAADYARWLGLAPGRIQVIRNGFALEGQLARTSAAEVASLRRAIGVPEGAPLVGSIFRYWPEKRPLLWARMAAAAARARPDAHFAILGWGPMQRALETLARRLGLGPRLHLLPAEADIARLLSALDVFVLTSRAEGTPNVILEAQYLGVPVVTTQAGGAAECVADGVSGWVDRTDTPDAIGSLVLRALADPDARARAAEHGPRLVRSRFGQARMIAETLAVYGLGR